MTMHGFSAGSDAVTTVTGYRGRSVQIKCPYDPGYEEYTKYLCRDTRFSLYDDTTAKIFTVTITDLRAEDANTYWCVVQQTGPNIYTKLQLLVKTEFPTSAFIIAVSVLLELLLIAILFTFSVQRKKKTMTQASFSALSPHSSSDIFMVPCPVSENEEVSNSLYSAVQLPSTPSEIYSNTGLPTIPSDPSPPVYAAIKHPGHQDVYSTAQLPSDSSVSAAQSSDIKSGESIKYATVSFNTGNISCDYESVTIIE
ncbi:CMRF35-like molecule 3 [Silurus meridionalis]|nr:CMRF35-like molecule 3 [Silurus meridionalis]